MKEGPKIYKHLIGPTKLKSDFLYLYHYFFTMTETRDQSIFMPALSVFFNVQPSQWITHSKMYLLTT